MAGRSTHLTRRTLLAMAGSMALPALAACATVPPAASATQAPNPLLKPTAAPGAAFTPVLASSELALGRNRFALGLIDPRNQPIASGTVHVEFFKVDQRSGTAQKRGEGDALFRSVELVAKGIWVSTPSFDEIGPWGAQVTLTRPGEVPAAGRLAFEVLPAFSAPGYGVAAPRSPSVTLADVGGDLTHLCSNNPPCDLHDRGLADLLGDGQKPTVVLFATPALCTSATCAPELAAVQALRAAGSAERAHFAHVEIYQYPFEQRKPVRAVDEWRLPSEPWTFVVDRAGVVRDRFEGAAPLEELQPALDAVLT